MSLFTPPPAKRHLDESTYQAIRSLGVQPHDNISSELSLRLANIGARVRKSGWPSSVYEMERKERISYAKNASGVTEGYASERTTPYTTPNVSPSKPPYSMAPHFLSTAHGTLHDVFSSMQARESPLDASRGMKRIRHVGDEGPDGDGEGEEKEFGDTESEGPHDIEMLVPLAQRKIKPLRRTAGNAMYGNSALPMGSFGQGNQPDDAFISKETSMPGVIQPQQPQPSHDEPWKKIDFSSWAATTPD